MQIVLYCMDMESNSYAWVEYYANYLITLSYHDGQQCYYDQQSEFL